MSNPLKIELADGTGASPSPSSSAGTGRTPRGFRPAWAKDGGTFGTPKAAAADADAGSAGESEFASLSGPGGPPINSGIGRWSSCALCLFLESFVCLERVTMICYSFFAFFIFMHLHFKLFARRFYATFRSCVAALVNLKNSSLARAGAGWEGRRSVGATPRFSSR